MFILSFILSTNVDNIKEFVVLTYLETSSPKGQSALSPGGFSTINLADIAALAHRQRYFFITDVANIAYGTVPNRPLQFSFVALSDQLITKHMK